MPSHTTLTTGQLTETQKKIWNDLINDVVASATEEATQPPLRKPPYAHLKLPGERR